MWGLNFSPHTHRGKRWCIADIDEDSVAVERKTVFNVDARADGESEALQLSNFGLSEDKEAHEIMLAYPRLFARNDQDWAAPCMLYRVSVEQRSYRS